jgi:hypothetical protein
MTFLQSESTTPILKGESTSLGNGACAETLIISLFSLNSGARTGVIGGNEGTGIALAIGCT